MTSLAGVARPTGSVAKWLLTWVSYVVLGLATLPILIPPGYSAPFYPAAGVAMAAVLLYGPRMVSAVGLAAFTVTLVTTLMADHRLPPPGLWAVAVAVTVAVAVAVGASLQAYLGAALIQRQVREPQALAEPADLANFLGAAALACVVNAGIGNFALLAAGSIQPSQLPTAFSVWWIGDLLGVLIALPVLMAIRGRPPAAWISRRASVALTLSGLTILIALGVRHLTHQESRAARHEFERDAAAAAQLLVARFQDPLQALEALHGLFVGSEEVTDNAMQVASRPWLNDGSALMLGWSVPVRRSDVPAFEASVRASGQAGFRVAGSGGANSRPDADLMVLRYVEPGAAAPARIGRDELALPTERAAIEQARRSGRAVASAPLRTSPDEPVEVVVYRALYVLPDLTRYGEAAHAAATRGMVSVRLRPSELARLDPAFTDSLSMCIVDVTPGAPPARLVGAPGCDAVDPASGRTRAMRFAEREWQIRLSPTATRQGLTGYSDAWLVAIVGLVSTAMLGGFLLTVTGRARRIELAVRQRTAALQAEVHDRQAAENALRESEQRFRNILDHVPIGVVYAELDGRVRQANLNYCRLAGRSETELLQSHLDQLVHPDDRAEGEDLRRQLLEGALPRLRRHERYLRPDGATVWVQSTVSLLRGASGQPRSILGVVEDITEHRLREEAERGRDAAEAANRAKSDFLSRMSHELRTPLNAMLGFAQLLELNPAQPLSEQQKPWVIQIQQAGWHLLEMINDVLDLSRIESGNLRLKVEPLDIGELVTQTRAMVEADAGKRGIAITEELLLGTARPLGDATRVKQILTNLLTNAVKYNADGGQIHVSARRLGDGPIELVVADTGLGLNDEQLAALFQPFNRLGRERSGPAGTGIGLVISQRLAELMGGSLGVHSAAGVGSAFTLTLPCTADQDTVRSEFDPLADAEAALYHRRRVHYVEDNETNVEVMRGILAQRPQVEFDVSLTGLDGLAAIRASRPDLILLDMNLPDIDGMELLRHLKKDSATRAIPVVVVSADALVPQIDAAFEAGCERYLTKPVNIGEVLSVVDDVLEAAETGF